MEKGEEKKRKRRILLPWLVRETNLGRGVRFHSESYQNEGEINGNNKNQHDD